VSEKFDLAPRARKLLEDNWDDIAAMLTAVVNGDVGAKEKSITCKHCGRRSEHNLIVQAKDVMDIVRFLRDTGHGRPSEQPKPPPAPPSNAKLEELSDDELLAMADGG
jgi:hypothetical protein